MEELIRRALPLSRAGVPQGDPLSPLAYLLLAEALSRMIKNDDKHGLHGIDVGGRGGEIRISQYADDTVLITDGSARSLKRAMQLVKDFCVGTGMIINEAKTEGVLLGRARSRKAPAGVKWAAEGEYVISLGVPIGNEFDEEEFWMTKYRKMKARLAGWSGSTATARRD